VTLVVSLCRFDIGGVWIFWFEFGCLVIFFLFSFWAGGLIRSVLEN